MAQLDPKNINKIVVLQNPENRHDDNRFSRNIEWNY